MLLPVRLGPNNEVLDYTSDVQDEPSQRSGCKAKLREYLLNNEGNSSIKDFDRGFNYMESQRSMQFTQRSEMPQFKPLESERSIIILAEEIKVQLVEEPMIQKQEEIITKGALVKILQEIGRSIGVKMLQQQGSISEVLVSFKRELVEWKENYDHSNRDKFLDIQNSFQTTIQRQYRQQQDQQDLILKDEIQQNLHYIAWVDSYK